MKRILHIIFICFQLSIIWAWNGSGTETDPYQITTVEELSDLSETVAFGLTYDGEFFKLCNNLDMNVPPYNTGEGWLCIGSYNDSFKGIFNGNSKIISNLYINRPSSDYIGIFGFTDNCQIRNLGLENVNITGGNYTGGIMGCCINNSIIDSCYVKGVINGTNIVGGILGFSFNSFTIRNSYVEGSINYLVTSNYSYIGVITGDHFSHTLIIENSYYDFENTLINGEQIITAGALYEEQFNEWLANDLYLDINNYLVSESDVYLINDLDDFKQLLIFGQNNNYSFILTEDIDLSDEINLYIPMFLGDFDGNSNIISGLNVDLNNFNNIGLFGYTENSSIRSLGLKNVNLTGNMFIGGLSGRNISSVLENCFVTGSVAGNNYIGGVLGTTGSSSIQNCYSTAFIDGDNNSGGFAGFCVSVAIHCYWDIGASNQSSGSSNGAPGIYGRNTEQMTFPYADNTYEDWNFTIVWGEDSTGTINDGYPFLMESFWSGLGIEACPYLIQDVEDLVIFRDKVNIGNSFINKFFRIENDIDLDIMPFNTGLGWLPIGYAFCGSLDGNHKIISNLYINRPDYYVGLFGEVEDSSIKNLILTNVNISGNIFVGGIVGCNRNNSIISDCFVSGEIRGNCDIGGITGRNYNHSIVTNCRSDIAITSNVSKGGGIAGESDYYSKVELCTCQGTINGNDYLGGIVGYNSDLSVIEKSFSTADIIGIDNLGGITGENCRATVTYCYAKGIINGERYVGGIVGSNKFSSSINSCYSIAQVDCNYSAGGLLGYLYDSSINDCYWNLETSNQINGVGFGNDDGTFCRTTDEMTYPYAENTYVGWDFEEIWQTDENYEYNNGYPYLFASEPVNVNEECIMNNGQWKISNFPNPFNPSTTIQFNLPEAGRVTLDIFNLKGQKVKRIADDSFEKGLHSVVWQGTDHIEKTVASGVYFVRMNVNGKNSSIRKMLLLK